jgi:hypothetical protein
VLEPRSRLREAQQQRVHALRELQSLLARSSEAFRNQNSRARTLLDSIKLNHPEIAISDPHGKSLGYDEIFSKSYRVLTTEEEELFKLIRGTTATTLRDTNKKMRKWLDDHPEFVLGEQPNEPRARLAKKLVELRVHLGEWLGKFSEWIPTNETRALVYLGDEKGHSPPFPEDLEGSVKEVLRTLDPNVK